MMLQTGETVAFAEATDEQVRWGGNDDPRSHLVLGDLYTVAIIDIHSWHTKITLDGFPNLRFNSVHFEPWREDER